MKAKTVKHIIIIALVLALILALVTGCKSPEQREQENKTDVNVPDVTINQPVTEDPDTVTVNGTGKVVLTPDIAYVNISVLTHNADAVTAQEENSAAVEAVKASIIANGVSEKDIQTSYINMYEDYDYNKDPAVIIGYNVSNGLNVTVRALDTLGKILSDAVSAGATNIGNVNLSVDKTTESYAQALSSAVEDSRIKAEAIAESLGAKLSELPISVTESSSSYTPMEYMVAEADATATLTDSGASEVSISEGELEVSASVTVIYELIPAQ